MRKADVKLSLSASKPAILFVAPLPPPYAGPEIATESLLKSSLRDRFRLVVINGSLQSDNRDRGRISVSTLLRAIRLGSRLVHRLIRDKCALVYLYLSQNRTGFLRDMALFAAGKLFRRPVVWHFRGGNLDVFYRRSSPLLRWLIRMALNHSESAILLGPSLAPRLRAIGLTLPLRVVANWAPLSSCPPEHVLSPPSLKEVGLFTVLSLGSLSVAKGTVILLRAAELILACRRDVRFVLAGGIIARERNILWDERGTPLPVEDVERMVRNSLNRFPDNIEFFGPAGPREKWKLLSECDVFVLPSYSEGFPISFMEAMAAGVPIVSTPVGAIPDILQEGRHARFVRVGDVRALADTLMRLIDDPHERRRIGTNNFRYVRDRHTVDRAASQIADIFDDVLQRRAVHEPNQAQRALGPEQATLSANLNRLYLAPKAGGSPDLEGRFPE